MSLAGLAERDGFGTRSVGTVEGARERYRLKDFSIVALRSRNYLALVAVR
jgi:hypothetical protein